MKGINANIVKYVDVRQWFVTIGGGKFPYILYFAKAA